MKLLGHLHRKQRRARSAFSLIELVVAISIILITFLTIFGGLTMGLSVIKLSRENLRATQIMLDKMEGVRLYNWDQITNSTTLQASFTNWFFETNSIGTVVAAGSGVSYTGQVLVASVPFTNSTSPRMRSVNVNLGWVSGGISHMRTMGTFVSQEGMQNYIYNN